MTQFHLKWQLKGGKWADLYPDSFLTQQYMQQGADLHMAQLMPLPLTVSRFSKIQIGFTFLVPAYPGSHGKRAIKQVRVRVQYINSLLTLLTYLQIMRQWRGTVVKRRSLAGELSLSCARPAADG